MRKNFFTGLLFVLSFFCFLACSACTVIPSEKTANLVSFYHQNPVPLATAPSSANVNGIFPDQVYIKTLTQSFCRDYQFCIVDGLIYYKLMPNVQYSNPNKDERQWQLLGGTGLPQPKKKGGFPVPKEIVEISADADSLLAFDSEGGMYQMFTNYNAPGNPFEWIWDFGFPERTHLVQNQLVKNKRAWATGSRRQDVLWHEDIYGNPHHYGTMGIETIYFLTEDGQHIRFTDSGLPADFSRSLQGPERGTFIAENLSASASTMFVINKAGTMYTRLADFDTIGCDPMFFKYTYEKLPQKYDGTQYLSNYSPWALPSEPWLKQPEIPLKGQARLTRHITILQNGRGNGARELRVAGTDATGQVGYYSKAIFDSKPEDWYFVPAPLHLEETTFLPVTAEGLPPEIAENLFGPSQELQYGGGLWQEGRRIPEIQCRISDFLMSEGSCTLELTYKDETKYITVHPVEMWSFMFRNNPGLDGTPKNFFITFEYPSSSLVSKYPEFEIILNRVFGDKNKALFSSQASATKDFFYMEVAYKNPKLIHRPLSARGDNGMPVVATPKPKKDDYVFVLVNNKNDFPSKVTQNILSVGASLFYNSPAITPFFSTNLRLEPGTLITQENRQVLDKALVENQQYYQMLLQELEVFEEYATKARLSRWGYNIVDLLTTVTLLNQIDFPKIKTVTSYGGELMAQNELTYRAQSNSRSWIYSHLQGLLEMRIMNYKVLQKLLDKGIVSVQIPLTLQDSHYEYLKAAGFPNVIQGSTNLGFTTAQIQLLPEAPLFPGFCLILEEGEERYFILIEFKDSVKEIYPKLDSYFANNLDIPVTFLAFSESGFLPKEVKNIHKRKGKVLWNGSDFVVQAKRRFLGVKEIFWNK